MKKINSSEKSMIVNTLMLYLMQGAKYIFPLLLLPYLTRILSIECYAVTTYVKSCMTYVQIIVDFGFILSATKDIARAEGDKAKIDKIIGSVTQAKLVLAFVAFIIVTVMAFSIKMLKGYELYIYISLIATVINSILPDYLFRGINKMQVLTYRFVLCKTISTLLTFLLVKGDGNVLLLPILDVLGSVIALALTLVSMHKSGFWIKFTNLRGTFKTLKESFIYFVSDFATTAFTALNTVLIGIFLGAADTAFWGVATSLVGAAQGLYSPITNGIYPEMVKTKSFKNIKRILLLFMPLIFIACTVCFIGSKLIITIISGAEYVGASTVFRMLLPMLFISFPAQVLGWPSLGAIGKTKSTTITTIFAAVTQVVLIGFLILIGQFNMYTLAIVRCISEFTLFFGRAFMCYKNRKEFSYN